jgi:antitoxin (DNA-binding transcriptional repressor) of toxin-antitoxin stability system
MRHTVLVPRRVTTVEVTANLLALLDDVATGDEIEITRYGRTVARLVPAIGSSVVRREVADVAVSAADDEALFSTGAWPAG